MGLNEKIKPQGVKIKALAKANHMEAGKVYRVSRASRKELVDVKKVAVDASENEEVGKVYEVPEEAKKK